MTNNFSISVDLHDLPQKLDPANLQAQKLKAMEAATLQLETEVKMAMSQNVRTGRTRASVTRTVTPDRGVVGSNVPVARYLEEGTRPHDIRPRRGRRLKWPTAGKSAAGLGRGPQGTLKGKGQFAYASVVHHPGTKAYRFFENAIKTNLGGITATFERFLREIL